MVCRGYPEGKICGGDLEPDPDLESGLRGLAATLGCGAPRRSMQASSTTQERGYYRQHSDDASNAETHMAAELRRPNDDWLDLFAETYWHLYTFRNAWSLRMASCNVLAKRYLACSSCRLLLI